MHGSCVAAASDDPARIRRRGRLRRQRSHRKPGASSEASGVLARRADWLTWTADPVKDRLDLSAPFTMAAWKADRGNASALLDVDAGNRSPTGYPTVSDAWREALSGRKPGLLSSAASGNARSEIYNRPLRWTTVSSPYSVRA